MSRVCQITGKKPLRGHNVSHAKNRTIKVQDINLNYKRYFLPELKQWVRIRVSTKGIKILTKQGGHCKQVLPFIKHGPVGDFVTIPTGQDIRQSTLAGSIWTHQGMDLAWFDGEVETLKNLFAFDCDV